MVNKANTDAAYTEGMYVCIKYFMMYILEFIEFIKLMLQQ